MILAPSRIVMPCPRCGRFPRPRFAPHWRNGVSVMNGHRLTRSGKRITRLGKRTTVADGATASCTCCGPTCDSPHNCCGEGTSTPTSVRVTLNGLVGETGCAAYSGSFRSGVYDNYSSAEGIGTIPDPLVLCLLQISDGGGGYCKWFVVEDFTDYLLRIYKRPLPTCEGDYCETARLSATIAIIAGQFHLEVDLNPIDTVNCPGLDDSPEKVYCLHCAADLGVAPGSSMVLFRGILPGCPNTTYTSVANTNNSADVGVNDPNDIGETLLVDGGTADFEPCCEVGI